MPHIDANDYDETLKWFCKHFRRENTLRRVRMKHFAKSILLDWIAHIRGRANNFITQLHANWFTSRTFHNVNRIRWCLMNCKRNDINSAKLNGVHRNKKNKIQYFNDWSDRIIFISELPGAFVALFVFKQRLHRQTHKITFPFDLDYYHLSDIRIKYKFSDSNFDHEMLSCEWMREGIGNDILMRSRDAKMFDRYCMSWIYKYWWCYFFPCLSSNA